MPTPLIRTGTFASWKSPVAEKRALNCALALAIPAANRLLEAHAGEAISAIIVLPCASMRTKW